MVFHILKLERAAVPLVFMLICALAWAQEEFEGLADPMRPYAAQTASPEQPDKMTATGSDALKVQSIVMGVGERYAIVSGQRVRVGSMIGDAYVEEILPRQVVLVRDARREVLPLLGAGADGRALVKKEVGHD